MRYCLIGVFSPPYSEVINFVALCYEIHSWIILISASYSIVPIGRIRRIGGAHPRRSSSTPRENQNTVRQIGGVEFGIHDFFGSRKEGNKHRGGEGIGDMTNMNT